MKKIILVLLVVLSGSVFGLDHGLITGFKVGYNMIDHTVITVGDSITTVRDNADSFQINMIMGYRIGKLRLIGEYTNILNMIDIDNYNPVQDRFKVEAKYEILQGLNIGFMHWCDHPVVTTNEKRGIFTDSAKRQVYLSFYREF